MGTIHLWPEQAAEDGDRTTVAVTIEAPERDRMRLWYRVPNAHRESLSENCDAFAAATVFFAMRNRHDVVVRGEVSPSLLRNLGEFQAAWSCWSPGRYTPIEIGADVERESLRPEPTQAAIAAFSGGVDSCFTALRHRRGTCGRWQRPIEAGLMAHGFDISLEQHQDFERAAAGARLILSSLGLDLITVATNFRELGDDWEEAHGAGLAACLMLFQRGYATGLIPSTEPYQALVPWGSNPVTDHLLSNDSFEIVHDGAAFTRNEKVRQISEWPEALQGLRVCWEGEQKDRNCGKCEKCIRTILNFRVLGLLPRCFARDASDADIANLTGLNSLQRSEMEQIRSAARAESISAPWVRYLGRCIRRNRRAAALQQLRRSLAERLPDRLLLELRRRSAEREP